jgi:VWFA-related protein
MDPSCQVVNVDLEVEYAAVAIGADIYVCPVKSVSLLKTSLLSADRNYRRVANAPVKTKLNDVSFSQYHLFRSEVRILADGGAAPAGQTANSESGVSEELPQGAETEVKSKETKSGEAGNGGASRSPASEDTRDGLSKPVQSLLATCPPVAGTANDGCEGKQSETSHSEGYADSTKPSRPISVQSAHAEAGSDSTMVLRESASLVLVDVIVTERGIPVHGVARERFHVFEDGNEQTINSFDEHFPAAKPAVAAITDGSLPPQLFSNVPQQAGGGALSVLLIDALNTSAEDSASVRRTVVEYLGKMEPDATLAIFTLSSRLLMVKGFTSDSSQLIKALKDEKKGSPPSVLLDAHDPFSVNPFGNELATSGEEIARIKTQQADVTADQTDERVRMTLEAMSELARYLGGIQGRKNVIWLSGSIPIALEPNDQLIDPMRAMRHYSEQVRETSDLLAAARVAVYPVDARGLMARPTDTVTHRPSPNIAYGRNNLSAAAQDNQAFESQTRSEHAAMETIAAGTGGRAFVSTNDLKGAIESAMADGSNYYTIGYRPMAGKSDGRFRAVRVQIDSGNYKLAYRSGYYNGDVKKFQATDDARKSLISAAVVHGAPPATQVLFKARLLDGTDPSLKGVLLLDGPAGDSKLPPGDAVRRYVAELTIDPHSITFDRKPEGGAALHLEVALVAYDSDGRRVNYLDRRMAMNLNPPQFTKVMADGVRARIALDVPAAAGSLRIAIEDLASPMIGSLEIALPINYR